MSQKKSRMPMHYQILMMFFFSICLGALIWFFRTPPEETWRAIAIFSGSFFLMCAAAITGQER